MMWDFLTANPNYIWVTIFYLNVFLLFYMPPVRASFGGAFTIAFLHFCTASFLYYSGWVSSVSGLVFWPIGIWLFLLLIAWTCEIYDDYYTAKWSSRRLQSTGTIHRTSGGLRSGPKYIEPPTPPSYVPFVPAARPWYKPEMLKSKSDKAWDELNAMVKEAKKANRQDG
jgi:hypothetical protein